MPNSKSIDNQFITNIFNKYFTAKLEIEKVTLKSDDYQIKYLKKHIQLVDTVLALMPKIEYKVIVKEFINKNRNWWKTIYKEKEYIKLKEKSINRFLYLYLI